MLTKIAESDTLFIRQSKLYLDLVDIVFEQMSRCPVPISRREVAQSIQIIWASFLTLISAMTWETGLRLSTSRHKLGQVSQNLEQKLVDNWQFLWKWAALLVQEDDPLTSSFVHLAGVTFHAIFSFKPHFWHTMACTPGFVSFVAEFWASLGITQWRSLQAQGSSDMLTVSDRSLPGFIHDFVDIFSTNMDDSRIHWQQFFGALGDSPAQVASNCLTKLINALKDPCISYLFVSLKIVVGASNFPEYDAAFESQGSVSLVAHLLYRFTSHRKPVEYAPSKLDDEQLVRMSYCFGLGTHYIAGKVRDNPALLLPVLRERLVRSLLKCTPFLLGSCLETCCKDIVCTQILPYLFFPVVTRSVRRCLNSIEHDFYIEKMEAISQPLANALTLLVTTVNARERTYSEWPRSCEGYMVRLRSS